MSFRFSYDIFSLLISTIVLFYVIRIRSLKTFRNRVFFMYVLTVITISVVDLSQSLIIQFAPGLVALKHVLVCLNYSLVMFVPLSFLIYIFALVDYFQMVKDENKNMLPFRIFFPISIAAFLIWASMFCDGEKPIFSYLDYFGGLSQGLNGYIILFIIGYYYIGFGVLTLVQHKYRLEKHSLGIMVFGFFVLNVAIVVQGLYPNVRVVPVSFAFSLILFSLFIQRPEFLKSGKTDVLNNKAFDIIISDYLLHKYNFKIIILCPEDIVFYRMMLGRDKIEDFEQCIVRQLHAMLRDTPVLKDDSHDFYYLLFKNASNNEVENILQSINEQIKNNWGYKGPKFDFMFRLCVVDGMTDITSIDELKHFACVFTRQKRYKGKCLTAKDIDFTLVQKCSCSEQSLLDGSFDNLIEVMYQPIYSVHAKRITRAEAVLSFQNDSMIVTTDTFLPVFEKTGLFYNINALAFNSVCAMISSIDLQGLGIEKMGINISMIDSTQQDLFEQIKGRLEHYNVSPYLVHFEINQSGFGDTPDIVIKNLQKLSSYGIEIVFDNFGFDNSNVNQAMDFSFGMVKLDARAVEMAWGNSKIGIVLKSFVKMEHELGIQVIADGVETVEQRIWLEGIGCDYLQGKLFGKPLPEDDFIRHLEDKMHDFEKG